MKRHLILPLALSVSFSSGYAGTMGEPTYDFSGFYAGLGTGFTSIFTKDTFSTTRSDGLGGNADTNRYTNTAILFTGQIGYGVMVMSQTYLGAKGSIYYTPLDTLDETGFSTAAGSTLIVGNNSITTSVKPIYNIDAVLGYQIVPHFLPFVEAGVTFADVNRHYTFKRSRTNITSLTNVKYESVLRLDDYKTGFNVGLGMNYQPVKNWFFSTELVYNYLGKESGSTTVGIPATSTTETQTRENRNSDVALFGGVSYLFNI